VEIPGRNLREIASELESRFPGIAERLVEDDAIAAGLAASIDGAVASRGMHSPVGPNSEVHFLPAIGGG
jgi:molybdopterin synthase sulfur carrier subunit